jgi:hypothetical protein
VGGTLLNYAIDLRHLGSFSNTFALTVNVLPIYAYFNDTQVSNGVLDSQLYQFTWRGTLTGVENWTATYQLSLASLSSLYVLTNSVRLTAPGIQTIVLTPTVIVNAQYWRFLPLLRR